MKYLYGLLILISLLIGGQVFAQWPTGDWFDGSEEMGVQYGVAPDANYTNFALKYLYEDDPTTSYPSTLDDFIIYGEYWGTADGPWVTVGYVDIDDMGIPPNSVILEAKAICTEQRSLMDAGSPYLVGVFRIMKPMDYASTLLVTWNTYDGTNSWSTAGANDTSGDWKDVFGGSGDTDYTILSHHNQMDADWNRTLGAGFDSLTATSVESSNGIDVLPFPEDITMLVDSSNGLASATFKQWIDMTNYVRGIYSEGHENYGFVLKIMNLDIAGSGNEGTITTHSTNRSTPALRFCMFVRYLTIGDGVGSSGGGNLGDGGMN